MGCLLVLCGPFSPSQQKGKTLALYEISIALAAIVCRFTVSPLHPLHECLEWKLLITKASSLLRRSRSFRFFY
jgi:hypothetical protein